MFVGLERGYFEELNVNLDMVRFNSGALMIAPLANGDLDAGSGGTSPGIVQRVWPRPAPESRERQR